MSSGSPVRIGIAVVEAAGQILVGWRGADSPLAGFAEFPGGKCEPGESPEACAVRECLEEAGLPIEPVRLLLNVQHTYPHATVDLTFLLCRPTDPSLDLTTPLQTFRWIPSGELRQLRFPDANAGVLDLLVPASAD